MTIPIRTSTFLTDRTSNSFTITAEDGSEEHIPVSREIRINYDNVAPDISTAYGGATPIQNSNGTYELSSTVEEAQSGFDRVMVVFHRPSSIMLQGGRVYNPLYGTGAAENYIPWGSLTESPEGLPLRVYTGAIRGTSTTSLTHAAASADPYARKGYYLRIGGIYHRITDVIGTTITWEGDVDVSETSFELVYAIAVDNLNTESASVDDGDGIREAVERSVSRYTWRCAIDSTNLPDGQMNIRYVAFDKAGNFAQHADIVTRVENNPPLLAQVRLATNLDGSGSITDGSGTTLDEWNPPYSTLVAGVEQKAFAVDASPTSVNPFTAKDFMNVDIDIVGGNGALHYTLGLKNGATVTPVTGHVEQSLGTGGEDQDHAATTSIIEITLAQLQLMGDGARNFVFNIWDSTETYAPNTSTVFMAELTVALTVDVVDETAPVTVISPFFWNDADDNSLYGNSRENGHIELGTDLETVENEDGDLVFIDETGLYDKDPKVSGRITVRGTAFDDQRLTKLWMYLGNGGNDANAFVFTDAGDTETAFDQNPADPFSRVAVNGTYSLVAEFDPDNGWEVADTTVEGEGWRFTVDSESDDAYFNQDGHMVAWILEIDTAQLPRHAETDFRFRMIAEDKRTNAGGTSTPNASAIGEKRVDIVPYIRSIGSVLSKLNKKNPSAYNRTALGRYPVSEDETITVSGFNLGGDQSVSMAAQPSGPFTHTVNGVTTLNNENRNTAEYNQLPNGDNNPHLTDDVILDVWQLNSTAVHSVRGRIMEPVMKINPSNGMAGFAFANGVDSFSMANGSANSYTHWQRNYADYGEVAFGYD
ncbi:MAG: hypothetical protein GX550_08945, partial [Syntrophomonadaceae bacterium]|nr:hypothetical protein [Syntrophomonadaceae bacterium]